jgi:hypothetical protein
MRRGGWGSAVDAGSHEGVVSNLTAALKVSITLMCTQQREREREREMDALAHASGVCVCVCVCVCRHIHA